jgi:hypothetical protein
MVNVECEYLSTFTINTLMLVSFIMGYIFFRRFKNNGKIHYEKIENGRNKLFDEMKKTFYDNENKNPDKLIDEDLIYNSE